MEKRERKFLFYFFIPLQIILFIGLVIFFPIAIKFNLLDPYPVRLEKRGDDKYKKGNIEKALILYEKAFAIDSSKTLIFDKYLDCYLEKHDSLNTYNFIKEAVQSGKYCNHISIYFLTNFALTNFDTTELINIYNIAIDHNINDPSYFFKRSKIYFDKKNYDLALNDINAYFEKTEYAFLDEYLLRARIRIQHNDYEGAISDLKIVLERGFDDPEILLLMGNVYHRLDMFEEACEIWSKGLFKCSSFNDIAVELFYNIQLNCNIKSYRDEKNN
jgi:tetratricopeptide (TPR) repeat protein